MLPRHQPDRIRIAFDDHRLVANAGLILPATLALRLGLPQLVDRHLDLGHATGRANTGDKMMTLVASALAGGDWRHRRGAGRVRSGAMSANSTWTARSLIRISLAKEGARHQHLPEPSHIAGMTLATSCCLYCAMVDANTARGAAFFRVKR